MMAKIGLTGGFTVIPEGNYIFKVTKVDYNAPFGRLRVYMETADGQKHMEQFGLLDKKGQPNEGAMNAFSFFAKTLLDDFEREEIDDQELVGHYIKCSIEHQIVDQGDGKTRTYAHIGKDKEVAYGFDGEEAADDGGEDNTGDGEPAEKPAISDLKALLGM